MPKFRDMSAESKRRHKLYNQRPENKKKRALYNKTRRAKMRTGAVKKGDGKDVHHVVPLGMGGSTAPTNTRVVSASNNRGWRKKHPGMYGRSKK